MRRWSDLAERVAATTRTSEKTALLADYLRSLTPDELPVAAVFLTGRPFPEADQRAGGPRLVGDHDRHRRRRRRHAGGPRRGVRPPFRPQQGGRGRPCRRRPRAAARSVPTLPEVAATFAAVEAASGPAAKARLLSDLLARSDPATAKGIVKVLGRELRIGLREGLVEAAIAKAFDRPLDAVKWAGMLTGDVGRLAELARDDRLDDAELALFHPLKFMLASPAEDATEILTRLGPEVWVEDKYDGIRAQLHKRGTDVRLYSRDLNDVSAQFPEVVDAARPLGWTGVVDGEILAWKDGLVLPFQSLQARLGRKSPSAAIQAEVPVDLRGLRPARARTRRRPRRRCDGRAVAARAVARATPRLDALELPLADEGGRFIRSHLGVAIDVDALEVAFADSRGAAQRGPHGQGPDQHLLTGSSRPRLAEDEEGARDHRLRRRRGRGRARQAARRPERLHVRRAGHDERQARQHRQGVQRPDRRRDRRDDAWFEAHTIATYGRYRQVEPTVVVEIAFDVIVRSKRHGSGFSLRFPRIAALRPDKSVDEIDTVETVTALYEGLQQGSELLVTAGARTVPPRAE